MHHAIKVSGYVVLAILLLGIIVVLFLVGLLTYMADTTACNVQASNAKFVNNSRVADIVVSYTTMPDRLQDDLFKKNLSTMMEQTVRPKEIRVNIPYKSKRTGKLYNVPEWLTKLDVTIVRCDDLGPATKYVSTLEHFKDTSQRILVYDDDSLMPLDLVENFERLSKLYPDRCFTTTSYIFSEGDPQLTRYYISSKVETAIQILEGIFPLQGPTHALKMDMQQVDMVTGFAGYLITPDMVNLEDVSNFENLPKQAFFVDDVVMSASLQKKGTQIFVARGLKPPKTSWQNLFAVINNHLFKTQTEALTCSANAGLKNDVFMEKYFEKHWMFSKE